jgi:hypothetical protein
MEVMLRRRETFIQSNVSTLSIRIGYRERVPKERTDDDLPTRRGAPAATAGDEAARWAGADDAPVARGPG